jgi:hypothetical protein
MTKIVLLLVGSVVAFSLSGCAESWESAEGNANPAPYIPPHSTESHIPGPTGPNTSIFGR